MSEDEALYISQKLAADALRKLQSRSPSTAREQEEKAKIESEMEEKHEAMERAMIEYMLRMKRAKPKTPTDEFADNHKVEYKEPEADEFIDLDCL